MEEQARDAFFGELRLLARKLEKGRQELQESLDADTESTEQLDNLRATLKDASSLKGDCVDTLSASNSAHAEYSQALTACQNTVERCQQGLEAAVSFLEQYGYDRGSCSEPAPVSPEVSACPTTPGSSVSTSSRESDVPSAAGATDNSTPTLERAGISARTLATLRRGQNTHAQNNQTILQSAMRSAVPPSSMAHRSRHAAVHLTPNTDDLDRTLAELNIESVHVLGPTRHTGLTSMYSGHGDASIMLPGHSYAAPADLPDENTVHMMGRAGMQSSFQTPRAHQGYAGITMSSAFTNQSQQSYQQSYQQPTPVAQAYGHSSAFTPGPAVHASSGVPAPSFEPETPRPLVQSSVASYADPSAAAYMTPSASSAFSSAFGAVSQTSTVVRSLPPPSQPPLGLSAAFDIPMPDIQSTSLLPHRYQAGGGGSGAEEHITGRLPAGTPQMRPVSEEEYGRMPEYLRYQLTYELVSDAIVAVNGLAQAPRGDIPAGHFTINELRSMPAIGSKAQCTYLVLSKLSRIQTTTGFSEQTFLIL